MRVKTGPTRTRKHKKVLNQVEGFRGRRKNCFKLAERSLQRSLRFAFRDRRARKREFRALWIVRINAAARECGINYRDLMHGLKRANIKVDRKVLADLAVRDVQGFQAVVECAKTAL